MMVWLPIYQNIDCIHNVAKFNLVCIEKFVFFILNIPFNI